MFTSFLKTHRKPSYPVEYGGFYDGKIFALDIMTYATYNLNMKLISFIKTHDDWEKLLSEAPYNIKIKRDGCYVIFSYNQLTSDFSLEIVRECRGVILDETTLAPVCVPFYKFGNYGESYAPEIDWTSARVQEKIDGSLMKLWYDKGAWRVSTSGMIDANAAVLYQTDLFEENCPYKTYGDLFKAAQEKAGLDYERLDKNNTYMFELVGPYNKVVIMYDQTDIYHIGTRSNVTLKEFEVDVGIKKPQQFAIDSLESCVEQAKRLPSDKEGYVVVDKYYNRVKIKNPIYVALHHFKNNGLVSLADIVEIIRNNEIEEYVTYFPEYKREVCSCKNKIDAIIDGLDQTALELSAKTFPTQKDFALAVKDKFLNNYYFKWFQNGKLTARDWFWSMSNEKIVKILNENN